jgi:hypothetical protein
MFEEWAPSLEEGELACLNHFDINLYNLFLLEFFTVVLGSCLGII